MKEKMRDIEREREREVATFPAFNVENLYPLKPSEFSDFCSLNFSIEFMIMCIIRVLVPNTHFLTKKTLASQKNYNIPQ